MKNKTKNIFLMSIVMVVAFATFAFITPDASNNGAQKQNVNVGSMSMNHSFPAGLVSAKCGTETTNTVETGKKVEKAKCGSKDIKVTKMTKKAENAKCGTKDAKTGTKAVKAAKAKKTEGKCGQGKCGVS